MPNRQETQTIGLGVLAEEEFEPESLAPDRGPEIELEGRKVGFSEWRGEAMSVFNRLYVELQTLMHNYSLSCAENSEHKLCILDNRLRRLAEKVSPLGKDYRFPRFQQLDLGDEMSPTDALTPEEERQCNQIQVQIEEFEQELELFKQTGSKIGSPNKTATKRTGLVAGTPARRMNIRPVDANAVRASGQIDAISPQVRGIEEKIRRGRSLSREDLLLLYGINFPVGYQTDPRIQELRQQRDPNADMPIVFDCEPSQIAHSQDEVTEDTKAYVGPLFPNIFRQLKDIEHIYTKFPEGKIQRTTIEIGGKTKKELKAEMRRQNIQIGRYAEFMMDSKDFTTAKNPEQTTLVRLKVGDLNLQIPNTENIYKKAEEFGLELCPAEVGPHYRLNYSDQPTNEWLCVGMKQISGSDGGPNVFNLHRGGGGVWLDDRWAGPANGWSSCGVFVFRLRK